MKRPVSSKHKNNGYWGSASKEDTEDAHHKNIYIRNKAKIIKPDLTTNDFSRILPRKMYKDKERLYSQGLQLKQAINQISQENIRLKTQVSMLERQKFRVSRMTDPGESSIHKNNNNREVTSNIRVHQRENKVIKNLKRMLRQYKEENDNLSNQNRKIRKTMKYIKINELEIQMKVIIEENEKLAQMVEQYASQLNERQNIEIDNQDLQIILEKEYDNNRKLQEENKRLADQLGDLEQKMNSQSERWRLKQNRLTRELNQEKKKCIQTLRHNQDLKRQLMLIFEAKQLPTKKRNTKSANRNGSNYVNYVTNQSRLSKNSKGQQQKSMRAEDETIGLKLNTQNQNLLNEISNLRKELQKVRQELSKERENRKSRQSPKQFDKQSVNSNYLNVEGIQKSHLSGNKRVIYEQSQINVEAIYDDDQFEDIPSEPKKMVMCSQNNEEDELRKIKEQFNDKVAQEEILVKEDPPKSNRSTKKNKEKLNKSNYKPDKEMLTQLRQLLTYRMKSQRYPFSDLQNDINNSQIKEFTNTDLTSMLANEPFYLNAKYVNILLQYFFQKKQIALNQTLKNTVLIAKLRKVISPFDLMSEQKQKQLIIKIAQMTSAYPEELQLAFEDIKNGQQTASKNKMMDMFKKLGLQDQYIDLIIAQLSLCSEDLEHLNYQGFFERFYIQQEDYQETQQIEVIGEESEQSLENSSRAKKVQSKGHNSKKSL